jgi:hypothetical protein
MWRLRLKKTQVENLSGKVKGRFVPGVLLTAIILTLVTLIWPASIQGFPPVPLTPGQMRFIAEKEQARKEAGVPDLSNPEGEYAQPGEPVFHFVKTIQMTKAEILAGLEAAWATDKQYINLLEREGRIKAAQRIRKQYEEQRWRIEALTDDLISLDIPVVKVGRHSMCFSKFTYDSGYNRKDPINVVFYRKGTAWDVQYDMRNWTRLRWQQTGCGVWLQVYICDAQHTGGWDGWRGMEYQLEREQGWWCGSPRYHLRLFGSFVEDSHGLYGWWSVGDAHHDNRFHTCVDGWESAEYKVYDSFRDNNGHPLWFVGAMWQADLGNAGHYQCAYNNGWARFIELIY